MKIEKRLLLFVLLIATMVFGSFSVTAFAKETFQPEGDPLTYTVLTDKTVEVSDC